MEPQYANQNPRSYGPHQIKMTILPSQHTDGDHSSVDMRALDCNLTSLCDHIQTEGFNSGSFSDIVVHALGSTYHLHRLILSRSSYFRNMLHGPWKEASAHVVNLNADDKNVNGEAIAIALAYLYGHLPKLNDNNAFRVLAAASFLDLQDLCALCTDFIISVLWTSNFLVYQVFAESQDYGIHGERVRNACWGYLCQSGAMELKEVLPKLSSPTLHALLTSDELWIPGEEKRFELALNTLLAKVSLCKTEQTEREECYSDLSAAQGNNVDGCNIRRLELEVGSLSLKNGVSGQNISEDLLVDIADYVVDFPPGISSSNQQEQQSNSGSVDTCNIDQSSPAPFSDLDGIRTSCSYIEMPIGVGTNEPAGNLVAMEGPSEEGSFYHLNNNTWRTNNQSGNFSSIDPSWGSMPPLSWGGRVVGNRQLKGYAKGSSNCRILQDEYDTFASVFEGGSLLYGNMSFDALLNARRQLEELGFPCKAVNDGLWLQMLLRERVQGIGADTCKNCCLTSTACSCRKNMGFSHGVATAGYYMQEHDQNNLPGNMGNIYVADSAQGEGNGIFRPVRVHIRGGQIDGLAGIGRGNAFVPATAWPPTRFVFSRVPLGINRNGQQSFANDDSEIRADFNGDVPGDGLTALVGLSQGGERTDRGYETDIQGRSSETSLAGPSNSSSISMQMLESPENPIEIEWENASSSSISLDMKTPLNHFPPFRFGVEFEDVHRLNDGQVKHSPEFYYAGSLWKVSVQAFNDEDPQGRRTLGLFLHRRKGEITDTLRKVHMFVDSREKVTARYQLICPSKREVMVFGSFKQRGTLLPKAPKGWGWRTALLFDELSDLLQNGALRVAAVVQVV